MGFMILMGVVHLPALFDYWKNDPLFHYSPVASRISRRRFVELSKYLHFVDNSSLALPGSPNYNKLGKIEPILLKLKERCVSLYNLNREVSIDEAMIPFKGRSSMKQYLPLKPVKRGFKVWVLADAHNGYVSQLEVYTGKSREKSDDGLGASVVKSLCKNLKHR